MQIRTTCENEDMGTLEEELQKIHDAGIAVWISWLWDGGVDVWLVNESGNAIDEGQSRRSPTRSLAGINNRQTPSRGELPARLEDRSRRTPDRASENLRLRDQHRNLVGWEEPDRGEARE